MNPSSSIPSSTVSSSTILSSSLSSETTHKTDTVSSQKFYDQESENKVTNTKRSLNSSSSSEAPTTQTTVSINLQAIMKLLSRLTEEELEIVQKEAEEERQLKCAKRELNEIDATLKSLEDDYATASKSQSTLESFEEKFNLENLEKLKDRLDTIESKFTEQGDTKRCKEIECRLVLLFRRFREETPYEELSKKIQSEEDLLGLVNKVLNTVAFNGETLKYKTPKLIKLHREYLCEQLDNTLAEFKKQYKGFSSGAQEKIKVYTVYKESMHKGSSRFKDEYQQQLYWRGVSRNGANDSDVKRLPTTLIQVNKHV